MRTACPRVRVISVVIKQPVMGLGRGCSALAPGRPTWGSHQHYRPADRTIMPLMEGNSGCTWRRLKVFAVCCTPSRCGTYKKKNSYLYILIMEFWTLIQINRSTFSQIYPDFYEASDLRDTLLSSRSVCSMNSRPFFSHYCVFLQER